MERDSFKCTQCGDKKSTLNIHHWKYTKNPWDAPNSDLSTVCESCHNSIEETKDLFSLYSKSIFFRNVIGSYHNLFQKSNRLQGKQTETEIIIRITQDEVSQFDKLIHDINPCFYKEFFEEQPGFTKGSEYGFTSHRGIFIQWDRGRDERILSWIDEIDFNYADNLLAAAFWKGSISLVWKNKIPDQYKQGEYVEPLGGDTWYINESTLVK